MTTRTRANLRSIWSAPENQKIRFMWLNPLKTKNTYGGFEMGNLKVKCGDCILIRVRENTDGIDDYNIARLLSCHDARTKIDNLRGCVQWYSRVHDIPDAHFKLPEGFVGKLDPDREILQENRGFHKEIDLETIAAKCHVEETALDITPETCIRPEGSEGAFYLCRLAYGKAPAGIKAKTKFVISPVELKQAETRSFSDSPGKENIPPSAGVAKSVKRRLSPPAPHKKCVPSGPVSKRRALQPVISSNCRAPDAMTFLSSTKKDINDKQATPTAKHSKNLNSEFDEVEKLTTRKSPKEKLEDFKNKSGYRRKLDTDAINSALQEIDSCDESDSDFEELLSPVKPKIKISDIIKVKSYCISSTENSDSNDSKISCDNRSTPIKLKIVTTTQSVPATPESRAKKCVASNTPVSRRKFPCNQCSYVLRSKNELDDHLQDDHNIYELSPDKTPTPKKKQSTRGRPKSGGFVCKVCDTKCKSKQLLADHHQEHHNNGASPAPKKATATTKRTSNLQKEEEVISQSTPVKSRAKRGKKDDLTDSPKATPGKAARKAAPKNKFGISSMGVRSSVSAGDSVSVLERARERLHVSAVPDSLPCREEQCQLIYDYVEAKLMDGTGGCMYVSGVPGTGKTATVREVVRLLRDTRKTGELPDFTYIEVNALRLSQPRQVWSEVWSGLTGQQRVTPDHAASLLEKRFRQPGPRRQPTLLLVDELDLLWTRKQDVLYNLFEWPTLPSSQLVVIAVANTMDLPERLMMARVSSRLGLTRVTFHPYTHHQLQEIVSSRLEGIGGFESDAIQLVSRKVAAVSGDARRALDICRRATELADITTASPRKSPIKKPLQNVVGVRHVDLALREMFTSPKIMAIRCCSGVEQQVLRAVLQEFHRTGVEEASLQRVYSQFLSLSIFEGRHKGLSLSGIVGAVNRLSGQRLLITTPSGNHLSQRITLNLSMQDVKFALDAKKADV